MMSDMMELPYPITDEIIACQMLGWADSESASSA